MKPSSAKNKGKKYEEKIAKILQKWFMENNQEYNDLFESVGNEELRPQRDFASGNFTGAHGDINLNLLKKFFPYSIECKHWKSLDMTLNQLIKGNVAAIKKIWKVQVLPKAKQCDLRPLLVFSGNRTEIFTAFHYDKDQMLMLIARPKLNFVISDRFMILRLSDFLEVFFNKTR